jgi:hypothetical protein
MGLLNFEAIYDWSFRIVTFIASKFPIDWNMQGQNMGYKVVYLVKAYNIPLTLVINNDQTKIHLVPTIGKKTWENKGTKHIISF